MCVMADGNQIKMTLRKLCNTLFAKELSYGIVTCTVKETKKMSRCEGLLCEIIEEMDVKN